MSEALNSGAVSWRAWIALVGALAGSLACVPTASSQMNANNYKRALESGTRDIPYARDFSQLFPKAVHFYSYYSGKVPLWNSKAGLYGRYILTMQIPVSFDESKTKVISYRSPRWIWAEVEEIKALPDGRTVIKYRDDQQRDFGEKEWEKLVRAKGDLTSLGITPIKDRPIAGFDKHWTDG